MTDIRITIHALPRGIGHISESRGEKKPFPCETEKDEMRAIIGRLQGLELKDFHCEASTSKIGVRGQLIVRNVVGNLKRMKAGLGPAANHTIFASTRKLGSALTGVSESSIAEIMAKDDEYFSEPKEKKKRLSWKVLNEIALKQIPDGLQEALKNQMPIWWKEEVHVTLKLIGEWMKEEFDFELSSSSIARSLHAMGFCYRLKTYNPLVNTQDHIVEWRKRYIATIAELRSQGYYIAYFDETWVFSGMNPLRGWMYGSSDAYSIASSGRIDEPVEGPVAGNTKGERAIALAVLTEEGILPGSVEVLISGVKEPDQVMDYHREMTMDSFEEYWKKRLPLLAAAATRLNRISVIVIDNASYHNRALEKLPTTSSLKRDLVEFLEKKGLDTTNKKRPELLQDALEWIDSNGGRKALTRYWFDEYAESLGVKVVRLPPYHCHLNPIELVWNQMKQNVRAQGKSDDKLTVVRERTIKFLEELSEDTASATIEHVIKEEHKAEIVLAEKSKKLEQLRQEIAAALDDVKDDDDGTLRTASNLLF